jgi:hypothetical protein
MVSGRHAGLSLVEVAVAMVVLGAGLLSGLALIGRAGSLLRMAEAEEGASREAAGVLDSLTSHGAPAGGAATRGRYRLRWTTVPESAGVTLLTLEVAYDDGRRARADTFHTRAAPWPREVRHVP